MSDQREPQPPQLTPELAALQRQLAGLELTSLQVDRDQLMYAAGRAAEQAERAHQSANIEPSPYSALNGRGSRISFWPAATAVMTAASVALAAMLVWEAPVSIAERGAKPTASVQPVIDVEQLSTQSVPLVWSPRPTSGYLGVRYVALTQGVGALRSEYSPVGDNGGTRNEAREPATAHDLLQELLPASSTQSERRS
jgi:hypothetical protein